MPFVDVRHSPVQLLADGMAGRGSHLTSLPPQRTTDSYRAIELQLRETFRQISIDAPAPIAPRIDNCNFPNCHRH